MKSSFLGWSWRFLKHNVAVVLLLFLVVWIFFAGIYGVDLGRHWDESASTLPLVTRSVQTGRLLPGVYGYPSNLYNLALAGLIPDALSFLRTINFRNIHETIGFDFRDYLLRASQTEAFLIRTRVIFLGLSALSVLWIFFMVRRWRDNYWEALLAAALFGLSWEVNYHMRWITPHMIMLQFAVLTMMCVVFFVKRTDEKRAENKGLGWLYLAAITAGLTTGTLYNGGVFILPVLMAAYFDAKKSGLVLRMILKRLFLLLGIFAAAYLVSTPGTILDPVRFLDGLLYEFKAYAIRGSEYTVTSFEHLYLLFYYFALVIFSKYWPIALFFFSTAIAGLYSLVRKEREMSYIFLAPFVVFVIFLGSLHTMYVRNALPLFPFFAIFAARGIMSLFECDFFKRWYRSVALTGLISVLLVINAGWLAVAAESIHNRHSENYISELAQYIDEQPATQFALSPAVMKELASYDKRVRPNVNSQPTPAVSLAVFRAYELAFDKNTRDEIVKSATTTITQAAQYAFDNNLVSKTWNNWLPNHFNYTTRWFGPYEVNFNYYPSWFGNDRIIVMPIKSAMSLGIF